jgi:hypothetical protein
VRATPAARAGGLVSRVHQTLYSAWAARRHRARFDEVERFLLFVGYPRSGHSLVGAILNAHRNAVVSHELDATRLILDGCTRDQLYARIVARAAWFHLRGDASNYRYRVPGEWQGRFARLSVIGDKRGGIVTRRLAGEPRLFDRIRALVRVPLKLVHVVRNPFDNVAAISLWHGLSLTESIDYYFEHCRTTSRLGELASPEELFTLRHEAWIAEPREALGRLCTFVGLEAAPAYLEAAARIVFERPTRTRGRVPWTAALVRDVERRASVHPFLDGYPFDSPS